MGIAVVAAAIFVGAVIGFLVQASFVGLSAAASSGLGATIGGIAGGAVGGVAAAAINGGNLGAGAIGGALGGVGAAAGTAGVLGSSAAVVDSGLATGQVTKAGEFAKTAVQIIGRDFGLTEKVLSGVGGVFTRTLSSTSIGNSIFNKTTEVYNKFNTLLQNSSLDFTFTGAAIGIFGPGVNASVSFSKSGIDLSYGIGLGLSKGGSVALSFNGGSQSNVALSLNVSGGVGGFGGNASVGYGENGISYSGSVGTGIGAGFSLTAYHSAKHVDYSQFTRARIDMGDRVYERR